MEQANLKDCTSMSFPSVSTGAFGYPVNPAAQIALRTIADLLHEPKSVKRVRFVLFDQRTYQSLCGRRGRVEPRLSPLSDQGRSMRKKLIAANWKMYKTPEAGAELLCRRFCRIVWEHTRDEIVLCPPFLSIPAVVEATRGTAIRRWRAGHVLGNRRRLHRRGLRADAACGGMLACDYRPFRAAAIFWRNG